MRLIAFLAVIGLIGGCGPSPPSPEPILPTSTTSAERAPFPPSDVVSSLAENVRICLAPLTESDWEQVSVDPNDAIRTALASRSVGNPGPGATGLIVWSDTGFIYAARYSGGWPFGTTNEPSYPADLIQRLVPPIEGFPGQNTALAIVDAQSGELSHTYGPCVGDKCTH